MGSRVLSFPLEGFLSRFRPGWRRLVRVFPGFQVLLGLVHDLVRILALLWRIEIDAGSSRFRQSDCDGLLGRPRSVLAFADVVDLFADELTRLRRCRLTFALVLARLL